MRTRRSLGRNNALLRRVQRHAEIATLYRSAEADAAVVPGRQPSPAGPIPVATLLPSDSTLPTGLVLAGAWGAGIAPVAQRSRLQPTAEPVAWEPRLQEQAAAEPAPAIAAETQADIAGPSVSPTATPPVQAEPAEPRMVATGPERAVQRQAGPAERPQPAASARSTEAPQQAAIQRAVDKVSQPSRALRPQAPAEAGSDKLTDSEWSRLKSFMEGHQEVVARQKAEEEALQRTPEAQAKREAEAKAEAERQRRIELARSGQMPRAQVVYLSPDDAAVGAGPQPPAPEPASAGEGEADLLSGPDPIQETIEGTETRHSEEPEPAPGPPGAPIAASEATKPAEVPSTPPQMLQRQATTAEPETPAEARGQIATGEAGESSASTPSPGPTSEAEAGPIPERPTLYAATGPAIEQVPGVQRAPDEVDAPPAQIQRASGPAETPAPDLASPSVPTAAPVEGTSEGMARTPVESGREEDAASTTERPRGLGRRLLDAARSLFRSEEEAAPQLPAEQQLTPAEPPTPPAATVQLDQETGEPQLPAAVLETPYQEEQPLGADAEQISAAVQGPDLAASMAQQLADEAPGPEQPAVRASESRKSAEPLQSAGPDQPPEAEIGPVDASLAEVDTGPPPLSVRSDKATPATPAIQRQSVEPAGQRPSVPAPPGQRQPPDEEQKVGPVRAESTRAEPARPEPADHAAARVGAEETPSQPETPTSAFERPAAVQAQLEGDRSVPAEPPETRPAADEDATLVVPGRPERLEVTGQRLEPPAAQPDRPARPALASEPAAIQAETDSEEPGATGQDEELEGQVLPLEAVWPVTPTRLQAGLPAAEPAAGPAETGTRPAEIEAAAGPTATEQPFVQRKIVSEDKTSDDVHVALQKVAPGRETDSAVELVTPRRPRPAPAVQRKTPSKSVPDPEAEKPVQRQAEEEDADHGEEASQLLQGPGRPPLREPTMVPTEIGDLPSDLWEILGERPPEPRSHGHVESPGPSDVGPANGLIQRTEAGVAVEAPSRPPLEMALGLDDFWVQRVETTPETTAETTAETSAAGEPETKKAAEPDIDELARKVYAEIKQRLITEYERSRGRF